jgi:cytochrome c oxidase assembly protein subunit 16
MVISGTHLSPDTTATLPFINMAVFSSKKFRSSAEANTIAARYRSLLTKHPFALFGLPFIATMVAGSFFLTPATAIRYEKHDRRVRRVSKEEELGIGKAGRKVDMKEEYYVSPGSGTIRKCAN